MDKKLKIYIVLLLLLVVSMLYLESTKKQSINWFPSYTAKHKIPYGTFVLRNELPKIFPNTHIEEVNIVPYIFLEDENVNGTYVFIDHTINFGEEDFFKLMEFVERGNDVFLSTHRINIDTLNIETTQLVTSNFDEKPIFKFKNKVFKGKEFGFDRPFDNIVFDKIDTLHTTVLGIAGYADKNDNRTDEGVNFVKMNYGKGHFFFHTFPEVFTNYNILNSENHQHAANILSYLNENKPILWDTYYKTGKSRISSPIYYLLNSKYLKWAYYIALIAVFFFVIFKGKRTQRSIPIMTPLNNQTVAFTQTISNMYFEKSEHKNIAEHKISYLLEYIRTKLHIPTTQIDETFYKYVSSRSGYSLENVEKLFKFCDEIHFRNQISEEDLIKLNKMIENFKNTIQYGK